MPLQRSIAVIVETYPKLSETFVANQINALVALGHRVQVFAYRKDTSVHEPNAGTHSPSSPQITYLRNKNRPFASRLLPAVVAIMGHCFAGNLKVLRLLDPRRFGRNAATLKLIADDFDRSLEGTFDLVIAHFGPIGCRALAHMEAGTLRGRLVTVFHGHDMTSTIAANNRVAYRYLFAKTHHLVTNSQFAKEKLQSLGAPASKIIVVPAGFSDLMLAATRSEHDHQEFRLVTVGRLVPVKGIANALRIVSALLERRQNLTFTVIGDGPLMSDLKQLAEALGIADHVHFTGALPPSEVHAHLANADAFLYTGAKTSDGAEETQGLAIQEAQAVGTPVVAWASGGVAEGIVDKETGYTVEPYDSAATIDRIERLIDSPELRESMGAKARSFARENYNSNNLAHTLVETALS